MNTRFHHISTTELLHRTRLSSIDCYITRRQLRWAGHVARMDFRRLPQKMFSCWVQSKRPRGSPQFTYGRGLAKALKKASIDLNGWWLLADNRCDWRKSVAAYR